jgi:hypothetical protein
MKNLKIAAIVVTAGVASFLLGIGVGAATDTVHPRTEAAVTYDPTPSSTSYTVPVARVETPAVLPPGTFTDGTYEVGSELKPGSYVTDGPFTGVIKSCYWERMKNLDGDFGSIKANGNIAGHTTIVVSSSDKGVQFSGGCEWHKK